MSGRRITFAAVALLAALCVQSASAGDSPALKAKRSEASSVLREISSIDERLSVLGERYDGARFHLQTIQSRLRAENASLSRARTQYHRATQQVAQVLVSLYTSETPSAIDAIFSATSFENLLTITDDQAVIAHQRSEIAATAKLARARLQTAVVVLRRDQRRAVVAVDAVAKTQRAAQHELAHRQQLLASVKTQIATLEAQQRARQQRLLAAARARLAAERAAQARAAAAAQAAARRAQAAAAARKKIAAERAATAIDATTSVSTTTTTVPQPADTTTTTSAAPSQPASPPPSAAPSGGEQQAAQVALNYIGVPYLWGGSSPTGFDCSGLVSYVYAQLGIDLPHFAAAQYGYGAPVSRDELLPGDLVFFDNLNHVGIYIGNDEFVDAPHTGAFVRIENLNDSWYASRYVGARRISP